MTKPLFQRQTNRYILEEISLYAVVAAHNDYHNLTGIMANQVNCYSKNARSLARAVSGNRFDIFYKKNILIAIDDTLPVNIIEFT